MGSIGTDLMRAGKGGWGLCLCNAKLTRKVRGEDGWDWLRQDE